MSVYEITRGSDLAVYYSEENTRKVLPFSDEQKGAILAQLYPGKTLFSGECVQLDQFKEVYGGGKLYCSKASFFDFMLSNMLLTLNDDHVRAVFSQQEEKIRVLLVEHYEQLVSVREPESIAACIAEPRMVPVIAVSSLIIDKAGHVLITDRSKKVAIGSGILAASSGGGVEPVDIQESNPLMHAALREIKEELGIEASLLKVMHMELVYQLKKNQPVVLIYFEFDGVFHEGVQGKLPLDGQFENNRLFGVPLSSLYILSHYEQSAILSYQLQRIIDIRSALSLNEYEIKGWCK